MPLTFMLDGDNSSTISFAINGTNAIQYRTNKMSEWQTYTSDTQIELTSSSDYVQFKNTAVDTSMRLGQFTISGETKALGNIQSLLNYSTNCHQYCYASMFSGCTSLTEAPELPATTLEVGCYSGMFSGCTSLQYIKVAFTVWDGWCTKNWVANVSPTGTFVCPSELDTTNRGTDYIPANWSVIK